MDLFYITNNGLNYMGQTATGKKLVFTKGKFGDGDPTGTVVTNLTDLINPLGDMPISKITVRGSQAAITTQFSNRVDNVLLPSFYLKEIGLYAKVQNSDNTDNPDYPETLVAYAYASGTDPGDRIPGNVLTEFIINWPCTIANTSNVSVIIGSIAYATEADLEALAESAVLKTDYASITNTGVIMLKQNGGVNVSGIRVDSNTGETVLSTNTSSGTYINSAGSVCTACASNEEIDAKSQRYKPIVPNNLAYAVQSVTGQLADLNTNEKGSFTGAINELASSSANIHKNPADTTGDIIDTHLSIGARATDPFGNRSLTVGEGTKATGLNAVAIGGEFYTDGEGNQQGYPNQALGYSSVAIGGSGNIAGARCAAICGDANIVTGTDCVIIGGMDNAITLEAYESAIVAGAVNSVESYNSVVVGGTYNTITYHNTCTVGGNNLTPKSYMLMTGHFNNLSNTASGTASGTTGDALIVGNGTSSTGSNAFRTAYTGKSYGLSSFAASGADYAEFFEWADGNPNNEDRRGRFVTLDGEKIRLATAADDYILGIVSANPCFIGDIQSEMWQGAYETDAFGEKIVETLEDGTTQYKVNPKYNPEQEYTSREHRKEWAAVGLIGKLIMIDDGTSEVNGYVTSGTDGIATKSTEMTKYRVMSRIDEHHIKVIIK